VKRFKARALRTIAMPVTLLNTYPSKGLLAVHMTENSPGCTTRLLCRLFIYIIYINIYICIKNTRIQPLRSRL